MLEPEGTGEFIDIYSNTTIYDISFISAYSIKNILLNKDKLVPSIQIHSKYLSYYTSVLDDDFSNFDYSWSVGLRYDTWCNENRSLKFGIHYNHKTIIEGLRDDKVVNIVDPDSTKVNHYYVGYIPAKLSFGLVGQINEYLFFLGGIDYKFWSDVPSNDMYFSTVYELENQLNFNANILYNVLDNLGLSLGVFNSNIQYKDRHNNDPYDWNLERIFITGGIKYSFYNLDVDLVIADSHLFVDDKLKQTIAKISIGYHN